MIIILYLLDDFIRNVTVIVKKKNYQMRIGIWAYRVLELQTGLSICRPGPTPTLDLVLPAHPNNKDQKKLDKKTST